MQVKIFEHRGDERLCSNTLLMCRYAIQILFLHIATHTPFSETFRHSPLLRIHEHKVPHPFSPGIQTLFETSSILFYA